MADPLRVTWLRPSHLDYAFERAAEVHERIVQRGGKADTFGVTDGITGELENRKAAFVAELAVSLYTELPWNLNDESQLSRSRADVGDDIEVKLRRRASHKYLIVEPAVLRRDWRYVSAYGEHPELWLSGWLWGHEVEKYPARALTADRPNGGGHLALASELRDIRTLEPARGRRLTCVVCREEIFVYEVPVPFCDPATFRCVFCLDPRHERAQLELVTGTPSPRTEVRNYDPEQAVIPY